MGEAVGGVPVRNVAQSVIHYAYTVYEMEPSRRRERRPALA